MWCNIMNANELNKMFGLYYCIILKSLQRLQVYLLRGFYDKSRHDTNQWN